MSADANHQIRLFALVGAFVTFLMGAVMMWRGIVAEGTIDLKSSVISGSIKTGSAGLFIVFLSFIILIFVLSGASIKLPRPYNLSNEERSRFKRLLPIFYTLMFVLFLSVGLVSIGFSAFTFLAIPIGFFLFLTVVGMLTFLEDE